MGFNTANKDLEECAENTTLQPEIDKGDKGLTEGRLSKLVRMEEG